LFKIYLEQSTITKLISHPMIARSRPSADHHSRRVAEPTPMRPPRSRGSTASNAPLGACRTRPGRAALQMIAERLGIEIVMRNGRLVLSAAEATTLR
jgi:hypothetical protein